MGNNILIVHYNPDDLEQRAKWATELGFTATTAKNSDEALNVIEKNTFRFALVDPLLPGISGFSLAEKIASSAPETTVFLASALYKRMQFVAHPGRHNIRMIHLNAPMNKNNFNALLSEYITLTTEKCSQQKFST